jgi:hypothetical protein
MLKIFVGYDPRQPIAYNILQQSILMRATQPVSITPLIIEQLPIERVGLTPFTWTRFLVPYLCDYKGWALFLDADMICLDDITKLFDCADNNYAVMVRKSPWNFEWASMMLFNCGHGDNEVLSPEYIEGVKALHGIQWTHNSGRLPDEWNHLVLYDEPRPDAKLVHYTGGIPIFPETAGNEYTDEYIADLKVLGAAMDWNSLMGPSVHKERVLKAKAIRDAASAPQGQPEFASGANP